MVFAGGGGGDFGGVSVSAIKKYSYYLPAVDQRAMMSAIRWDAKPSP
jgi:hypothetical protein